MQWQKKFEVGHDKIDFEHRIFFDLVQAVRAAEAQGLSRDKIRRLVAETAKYAEFHFFSEENIMIDFGYPEFEEHRKHHIELMHNLRNYIISFESGETSISALVEFLNEWFMTHTTNEDLRLSKYISQAQS